MPRVFPQIGLLFVSLWCVGCGEISSEPLPSAASLAERAKRRAYTGAPPVIPHPPLSGTCISCHTPLGREIPTRGMAPANPHTRTSGLSEKSRCKQCHLFRQTEEQFVENEFVPLKLDGRRSQRAHRDAPPTVPHPLFMREDCRACHAGPAARPEIVCKHTDRQRCVQCHVQADNGSPASELTRHGNRSHSGEQ